MLKQRRSSRQPRTDPESEGDGEHDAPPASRDAFPLYRHYQSDLNNYYDTAKQVLDDELDEKLTLKRHVPTISSGQPFSGAYPEIDPRGRGRTRMQAQVPESDEEDEYERYRRERERKSHRSSKKHRSPESRGEHVMQYRVNEGGRTTLQNSYSRATPAEEAYSYYPSQPVRVS